MNPVEVVIRSSPAGPSAQSISLYLAIISTAVSALSTAIAFAALIISQRAQRANYELQLKLSQRAGRLKQVMYLYPDKVKNLGYGFKIINGPDEVTVSQAALDLTYRSFRSTSLRWTDDMVHITVPSQEFKILGLSGREASFRLAPNDEVEWRFPRDLHKLSYKEADRNREQGLETRFRVTASGETMTSEPLTFGSKRQTLFREQVRSTAHTRIDVLLLGILARNAIQGIRSADPSGQVPSELSGLASSVDIPAELEYWLVNVWESSGNFSSELIEKSARIFWRACPPDPDPAALAILASMVSEGPD
jgi:hypothetical protein